MCSPSSAQCAASAAQARSQDRRTSALLRKTSWIPRQDSLRGVAVYRLFRPLPGLPRRLSHVEGEGTRLLGAGAEAHDLSVLDDPRELASALEHADVRERIALEDDDVRQPARLEHAHVALEPDGEGVGAGGRPDPSISVPLRMTSVRTPLDTDHDLERVVGALRVGAERVVDLVEPEVVGNDRVGQDLAGAHERQRAPAVHPALAARRVDAHVGAHRQVHVDLDRAAVPRDHADAPAALDVLERLLHRGGPARALQHRVGAVPTRDLAHALREAFIADVDREVGAQALPDREPRLAGAGEDDARGAEGLAELDGDEPDRARALHEDRLARHITAHQVDGPEGRSRRRHHAGLLEGEVLGQPIEGVDVVDGVLGEAAVAGEALRAVALRHVAIVQAGRVPALDAVLAALAALVDLHRHAVAHPELVDAGPQGRDSARVLVAHHELPGGLALERAVQHLHVRAADRRDLDLQQRLTQPRLGPGPGLDAHVVGAVEDDRLHGGGLRHGNLPPAWTVS